jgi:hypothetical protein
VNRSNSYVSVESVFDAGRNRLRKLIDESASIRIEIVVGLQNEAESIPYHVTMIDHLPAKSPKPRLPHNPEFPGS